MYVSNLHDYGHLLNGDSYDASRVHGDMYQMFDNNLVSILLNHIVGPSSLL